MPRILIVEDFASVRDVLRSELEIQGYVCHEVEDGLEALKVMQDEHFDLVITDYQMPGVNGLELLRRLPKGGKVTQPPVIFVTGNLSDDVRHAAERAGVCAFFTKPYQFQELNVEVTRVLASQMNCGLDSTEAESSNQRKQGIENNSVRPLC